MDGVGGVGVLLLSQTGKIRITHQIIVNYILEDDIITERISHPHTHTVSHTHTEVGNHQGQVAFCTVCDKPCGASADTHTHHIKSCSCLI